MIFTIILGDGHQPIGMVINPRQVWGFPCLGMDDTKYTTQLDHGTYVKIWVCPAGVHTFIHTYLGYSQYSLYIYIYTYMYTYLLVYCWSYVPRYSIVLHHFFLNKIFHCIPTISRCISIIYIYFSMKFRTNMALRPRTRFPNAKRRRTAWALAARGKDEQYVDPLVSNTSEMCETRRGIFWINNQHTLLIC